ncbi:ABC transporter ATP-binding protein [Gloeocapsopsis dulcis]|uniref:ABC transporter n=1 Tax=Gloeocapsopsis dulcis AAB1 = 1H9 TaxID=1433147 RepID=A0A6N8G186_9CHRO|nr:ABC transporter ATP-binding protein [Gloeocapsopsis dulcis]MUL38744.1 ABC transporter [Gloeocapsopsis dulcis AAB1 = 1H9]WNN91657.1 ABC transporter ATP-binding protein [Gloeocapsopsis dulcis]
MKEAQAIRTLLPLLKPYPWVIPLIIILGLLSSLSEGLGISLFIPFLQSLEQTTSQSVSSNLLLGILNQLFIYVPSNHRLLIIPLCIFGSVLLKNCLSYSNAILFSWLYSHISYRLRSSVFKQLLNVSYSFLDSNRSGKLLNTLATETWRACDALSVLVDLIISTCTIFVFVMLLLLVSWQLTLLVAVALILISLSIQQVSRQAKQLGKQAVQANDNLANRMLEGFYGMRLIRAFGQESYEQKRFDQASAQVRTTSMKLDQLYATIEPLSEVLSAALLLCILVIALLQDRATLPILLTFIFILYRLQPKVKQLDSARVGLNALIPSVEDVMSFLDRSDKPYIRSGRTPFKGLKQAIYFESVSFRYNPLDKPALRNVSIQIPQAKTTALVGPSGAGKSTLISLICRFYDVTEGEIYVDDCPLRQLNLSDWRSRIAIVSQDIHIFSATVRENIAYGRLEATEDEIIAAARQAHAQEFISNLPQGYDTQVGDQGIRLSGGQRQRIALARAILRNPEILILDEATNALDSVSEHLIQKAINTFSQDRTVIAIAHRLSTIEQADQIVVLEEGRVVEQGSLQHLLKLNGLFAKLYQLQYRSALT